jgi:hypothetical protein
LRTRHDARDVGIYSGLRRWLLAGIGLTLSAALELRLLALLPVTFLLTLRKRRA